MAGQFVKWVERQAQNLRGKILLKPNEILNPFHLAKAMDFIIMKPQDVTGVSLDTLKQLLETDSDGWSGGAMHLPNGSTIVVMNPNHALTRQHATLMEEISHVHLKHKPSKLMIVDGLIVRSYQKSYETAAYWVGAAALVPSSLMKFSKAQGMSKTSLAQLCGVSPALVGFRENVTHIKLS